MRRIEAKNHRGVLLLHDIHPATVMALPALLEELKTHGYKIVQAVSTGERPKSLPVPAEPAVAETDSWPRVTKASATTPRKKSHRKTGKSGGAASPQAARA